MTDAEIMLTVVKTQLSKISLSRLGIGQSVASHAASTVYCQQFNLISIFSVNSFHFDISVLCDQNLKWRVTNALDQTLSHRVSSFQTSVQPELPVPTRCRYYTSNWQVGMLSSVLWWHLISSTLHNQHFHFRFRIFAGKIVLSSKTTGKRNHLVHFGYSH